MGFFLAGVSKELRRLARDPWRVSFWLAIPLVLGGLLGGVMGGFGGGGGGLAPTRVVLVDDDDSMVSGLFAGALGSGGMSEVLEVLTADDEATARARVVDGDASAALVLPGGFQSAVLQETPLELPLFVSPAERIRPRIARDVIEVMTDAVFYAHRILGTEIRTIVDAAGDDAGEMDATAVAALSVTIHDALGRIEPWAFPPRLRVEAIAPPVTDAEGPGHDADAAPGTGGTDLDADAAPPTAAASDDVPVGFLFLPGVILMGLVLMAGGMSEDFWRERRQGTLRRIRTSPRAVAELLVAKTVVSALIAFVLSAVLLVLGSLIYGRGLSAIPAAVGWCVLAGVVFFLLMSALQLVSTSPRAGSVMVNVFTFPLLMIGGSFFPFEAMPDVLVAIGRWTPNGLVVQRVGATLLDRPAPGVPLELAALIGLGVVLGAFVAVRLGRVEGGTA